MYAPYFGLSREPFSLAPDPRFLFMSERHREALAHLLYGVGGGGGFVLLTGEIGAGKTTVARGFMEQLPTHCAVAYIFNPQLSAIELLQTVCSEFGIPALPAGASVKAHIDALNAFLLDGHARGRQALLVIDEAQALDPPVLEQLRLLTNLETAERKLLQIVLIGQPELRQMLAQPGLEQLAQRVIARYHLGPLTPPQTRQYIEHRLAVAGLKGPLPFDEAALAAIHAASAGVPRRINLLADRALLGVYGQQRRVVDRATVRQAAHEVFGTGAERSTPARRRAPWAAGLGVLLVAAGLGWAWWAAPPAVSGAASGAASSAAAAPSVASGPAPGASLAAPAAATSAAAAAVVNTPPAPAVRTHSLAEVLAVASADEARVLRELALRWGVAIGEGEACTVAAQAQLACFRSAGGGLALLRQLQRPALLALREGAGPRVHVLLLGLAEGQATLQVGSRTFQLPLAELARAWRGDFATFWRTPPGWRAGSEPTPAARAWMQQALLLALPGAQAQNWSQRVSSFQVLQGLPVDGQAGPLTLMQLNRAAGVDEPRLALAPER